MINGINALPFSNALLILLINILPSVSCYCRAVLIELGIPFSDPTAEGPVIQGANIKALAAGVTTDKVFDLVRDLRKDVTIPMVFMTYANVVYSSFSSYGISGRMSPSIPISLHVLINFSAP